MKKNNILKQAIQTGCRFDLRTILLVLTIFSMLATVAHSEDNRQTIPLPGSYKILSENRKIEFPFEIFQGDIRFECKVNGKPVQMLLDDGYMWDQLLFWGSPEVDSLGFEYDGEISVGGGNDSNQLASKTASGITVKFPGVEFTEQTAVITPYSSGTSRMWSGSVGQLSATFFRHFVVDINFDRMIITLHEPDKFEYEGKGVAIPWRPIGFGPWSIPASLRMENGRTESFDLLMDLGYNDQLEIVVGGEHNIVLPEKKVPASLGFNIARIETRGFYGRLSQIEIGGYQINDLIASYKLVEDENNAICEVMIGLGLLSRFNLVFDYNRQRLFVEPNDSFKTPFEYNMTGFEMGASFKEFSVIKKIHERTPAEEAGLQVGDKILKINDKKIAEYAIPTVRSMFRQKGKVINLLIERDGKQIDVALTLRPVI